MKHTPVIATLLAALSTRATAATLVVTSPADSGPGSLRDTVAASLPGDQITFSITGIIGLTSGAITIGNAISVVGPGPASLTVSGSGLDRVFNTSANPVLIANLTIRDGKVTGPNGPDGSVGQNGGPGLPAKGGGIYNSGALTSRTAGSQHAQPLAAMAAEAAITRSVPRLCRATAAQVARPMAGRFTTRHQC